MDSKALRELGKRLNRDETKTLEWIKHTAQNAHMNGLWWIIDGEISSCIRSTLTELLEAHPDFAEGPRGALGKLKELLATLRTLVTTGQPSEFRPPESEMEKELINVERF